MIEFKLIIAGSREFADYQLLKQAYSNLPVEVTEIVSGGARGADKLGEQLSLEMLNKPATVFKADWEQYGKSAGFIRNQQMAEYADGLLALWMNHSRGTEDMIRRAKKNNLLTIVVEC